LEVNGVDCMTPPSGISFGFFSCIW